MDKVKLSIPEKIRLWWKFDGKYYHHNFINGIKNIIKWFPVIWKDRNYDHSFIYTILKTKLDFQSEYIGKHGIHLNVDYDVKKMKLCSTLIEKLDSNYYLDLYHDYYKSNMKFIPLTNEEIDEMGDDLGEDMKGGSRIEFELVWEKFDDFFQKYPHAYKVVTQGVTPKDFDEKQTIAFKMSNYLHVKAKQILFQIIDRNIEHWWD
jgi:hypothetical protein